MKTDFFDSPHVLMIPSWYTTLDEPLNGSFFKEYACDLKDCGVNIGIIYPEIRQLRNFTFKLGVKNRFQKTIKVENNIPTCRMHGWNLQPKWMKMQMWVWMWHVFDLFEDYVKCFGKPDLIHAQSCVWAGIAASRISAIFDIPYCITEHRDGFVTQNILNRHYSTCWSTAYISEAYDNAEVVVAVSSVLKKSLRVYFQEEDSFVHVIPNPVDTNFFKPARVPKDLSQFVFITIAHLVPRKNISSLIKAFHLLQKEFPQSRLHIGGDGPERNLLENLVDILELRDKVVFLGALSREQVRDALQVADAFVLSSLNESFGVVCIEAIACGIPIVSTRCGGVEDIVNYEVGYLVSVDKAEKLCEGMGKMIRNKQGFKPFVLHDIACRKYSKERVMKQYLYIYEKLASLGK